jgi:predicted DsbA family dithiol-disulfide isomerase
MSAEQAREAERQMTETAAGDGLEFRFDVARAGNTFDGHRLVHLARAHGLQDAMKERLLRAYLTEGRLVSDHATLAGLAEDVGLPADEVRETLAGDRYAAEVREDERTAHSFGISAVPTFVVDRRLGASGAHPPEALLGLLRQGWESRSPVPVVDRPDGESCGVDGC